MKNKIFSKAHIIPMVGIAFVGALSLQSCIIPPHHCGHAFYGGGYYGDGHGGHFGGPGHGPHGGHHR